MAATTSPRPWPTDGSPTIVDLPSASPSQAGYHEQSLEFPPRRPSHRHSLQPPSGRRPLRSSPLAGPVLQLDDSIPEAEEENHRPSRTCSTPDVASLIPSPPLRKGRPKTAENPLGFSRLSIPSAATLKRPTSHVVLGDLTKKNGESTRRLSQVQPTLAPSSSLCTLRHPPSMAEGLRDRKPTPSAPAIQRPRTAHGYPIHPKPLPSANLQFPEHIPRVHTRDKTDNSWLTANTYDTTPKFSRLGLASSGVVLPVSAKEHKRIARQSSELSVKTSATRTSRTDGVSSSPDTSLTSSRPVTLSSPNSGLARSNSSNSSSESLALSQPRGSTVTSVTAAPLITTIAERVEIDHRHDSQSHPNHSHQRKSIPAITPKKGPLTRLKGLGMRSIRSSSSLASVRLSPISEKVIIDASPSQSEIKLGLLTPRSMSSMSGSTEESKVVSPTSKVSSTLAKRASGMKKIWKSITSWQSRS
ncbi:hypothetical protein P691DRAFT_760917 [Macrolepiota fuliginosa MF-IS2]|uniref:Uncharacterized protein n=1 Tax=Macrolepiota fuliginosa MF-IS2 TaxID=1400762 RepID=A0A9P5X9E6_9AGAR|nr:hypothetical protein P691DRAFT_760917 [Macrolepiota fuliginosa MF-IS2]